jgi:6-pyruvoyl-tetrahydropterin synthase
LTGDGAETDMVTDFAVIEAAMEKYVKELLCHRTILYSDDPLVEVLLQGNTLKDEGWFGNRDSVNCAFDLGDEGDNRVQVIGGPMAICVLLPFAPTAERLAQVCYHVLAYALNDATKRVMRVRFWETSKCYASYPA